MLVGRAVPAFPTAARLFSFFRHSEHGPGWPDPGAVIAVFVVPFDAVRGRVPGWWVLPASRR